MSDNPPSANPSDDQNEFDPASDCFAPPAEPCLCYCLHCRREVMSDGIWFQKEIKHGRVVNGFWMCPTPNCDGAGFTFDLFPVDPNHPANEGWVHDDDETDAEWDAEIADEPDDEFEFEDEFEHAPAAEYDPAESSYGRFDDDIEGDEWKHGLSPGETLPESPAMVAARKRWEEEEKRYNGPDLRPREVDRTGEPDPPPPRPEGAGDSHMDETDIPF